MTYKPAPISSQQVHPLEYIFEQRLPFGQKVRVTRERTTGKVSIVIQPLLLSNTFPITASPLLVFKGMASLIHTKSSVELTALLKRGYFQRQGNIVEFVPRILGGNNFDKRERLAKALIAGIMASSLTAAGGGFLIPVVNEVLFGGSMDLGVLFENLLESMQAIVKSEIQENELARLASEIQAVKAHLADYASNGQKEALSEANSKIISVFAALSNSKHVSRPMAFSVFPLAAALRIAILREQQVAFGYDNFNTLVSTCAESLDLLNEMQRDLLNERMKSPKYTIKDVNLPPMPRVFLIGGRHFKTEEAAQDLRNRLLEEDMPSFREQTGYDDALSYKLQWWQIVYNLRKERVKVLTGHAAKLRDEDKTDEAISLEQQRDQIQKQLENMDAFQRGFGSPFFTHADRIYCEWKKTILG